MMNPDSVWQYMMAVSRSDKDMGNVAMFRNFFGNWKTHFFGKILLHIARRYTDRFADTNVNLLPWPALSVIEHAWGIIRRKLKNSLQFLQTLRALQHELQIVCLCYSTSRGNRQSVGIDTAKSGGVCD